MFNLRLYLWNDDSGQDETEEKDRSDLVLFLSDSSTSLFSGDVPLGILPVASLGIGASRCGHCDPCRADQKVP